MSRETVAVARVLQLGERNQVPGGDVLGRREHVTAVGRGDRLIDVAHAVGVPGGLLHLEVAVRDVRAHALLECGELLEALLGRARARGACQDWPSPDARGNRPRRYAQR